MPLGTHRSCTAGIPTAHRWQWQHTGALLSCSPGSFPCALSGLGYPGPAQSQPSILSWGKHPSPAGHWAQPARARWWVITAPSGTCRAGSDGVDGAQWVGLPPTLLSSVIPALGTTKSRQQHCVLVKAGQELACPHMETITRYWIPTLSHSGFVTWVKWSIRSLRYHPRLLIFLCLGLPVCALLTP